MDYLMLVVTVGKNFLCPSDNPKIASEKRIAADRIRDGSRAERYRPLRFTGPLEATRP